MNKLFEAAERLSDAASKVISHTCLSDLEKFINELSIELIKYDLAVKNSKCDFCSKPCLEPHCHTRENIDEKEEN